MENMWENHTFQREHHPKRSHFLHFLHKFTPEGSKKMQDFNPSTLDSVDSGDHEQPDGLRAQKYGGIQGTKPG